MTLHARGHAAASATSTLTPYAFDRRDPRPDDVLIEILYCGVCHIDLHIARNHGGFTRYPVAPGHEVVGRVLSTGAEVTRFAVGDLVGVGCMVDSCRRCTSCNAGLQQHCLNTPTFTYNGTDRHDARPTFGGYSDRIVVSEDFVLQLPTPLEPAGVAPLLCAGITTWSPLRRFNVTKGSRVAVVGLGGLGHVALKLAHAMGAEVTLFTRSPGKEADALRLGADRVVLSTDAAQMASVAGRFDLVLDTVPYAHDLNPYLPTLSVSGTVVIVGYMGPLDEILNTAPLVFGRRAIAGSFIGGLQETQEMLDFCGQHGVTADVELIPIQSVNQAYERLRASDVKYRFVIDMKASALADQSP